MLPGGGRHWAGIASKLLIHPLSWMDFASESNSNGCRIKLHTKLDVPPGQNSCSQEPWLCRAAMPWQLVSVNGELAGGSGSLKTTLVVGTIYCPSSSTWEQLSLLGSGCVLGEVKQQYQAGSRNPSPSPV